VARPTPPCRLWKASAGPVRGLPVSETRPPLPSLAALKAERATVAAKGRQIETEAAPIRYVAELLGTDTDSEKPIRWLIALMVLTCDPLQAGRSRRICRQVKRAISPLGRVDQGAR
jgi:hypothetical protein